MWTVAICRNKKMKKKIKANTLLGQPDQKCIKAAFGKNSCLLKTHSFFSLLSPFPPELSPLFSFPNILCDFYLYSTLFSGHMLSKRAAAMSYR